MKGSQTAPGVRAYEDYSTRAWPAVVALGDALAFQAALGEESKHTRYQALWTTLRDRVEAEPTLVWRSPRSWAQSSMLASVEIRGRSAALVAPLLLDEHQIVVRGFGAPLNALRVSPNVSTTDEELHRALDVMVSLGS